MEDVMTYRMRIGTFAGVAAVPAVIKRSRSIIRKLKRRRRPIEDLHVKILLWFGFTYLLLYLCTSSYHNSVGYSDKGKDIASNLVHSSNITIMKRMFSYKTSMCYDTSLSPGFSYQTSVIKQCSVARHLSLKLLILSDPLLAPTPTMLRPSYLDSVRTSTMARIMPMDFSILPVVADNTCLDVSSLFTNFANLMQIDPTPLFTIVRLFHLKFAHQYSIISFPNAVLLMSTTTLNAGTGSCDFLLGNRGIHCYNGNMKRDGSPIPSTSSDEVVWGLHNKMVTDLGNLIAPSREETLNYRWRQFTQQLRRPDLLSAVEISKLKDMFDVFDNLKLKGKVNYGEYVTVKTILSDLQLLECLNIVTQCEEDMEGYLQDSTKAKKKHKKDATLVKGETKSTEESVDGEAAASNTEPDKDIPAETETYMGKVKADLFSFEDAVLQKSFYRTILTNLNETLLRINSEENTAEKRIELQSKALSLAERSMKLHENMNQKLQEQGIKILKAGEGSLFLVFTFRSQDSVRQLWNMYIFRELSHILQEGLVTPLVLKECNIEAFKLEVFIDRHDYEECLRFIDEKEIQWNQGAKHKERYYQRDEHTTMLKVEEEIRKLKDVVSYYGDKQDTIRGSAGDSDVSKMKEYDPVRNIRSAIRMPQIRMPKFRLFSDDAKLKESSENYDSDIDKIIDKLNDIFREHQSEEMKTCQDYMYKLAKHSKDLGIHHYTAAASRIETKTEIMMQTVDKWEEFDRHCYITKAMEWVRSRISSEHCNVVCVFGFPGSGKTTTIRNAAIYMKQKMGFSVYPISYLTDFQKYIDKSKKQIFVFDNIFGEYNFNFKQQEEYVEMISYSSRNTKILTSTHMEAFKGLLRYECEILIGDLEQNNILFLIYKSSNIMLSDAGFQLSEYDMKHILRSNLEANNVTNVDSFIERVNWNQANDSIPLLWKVYSQDQTLREKPYVFLKDPVEATINIFKEIKTQNKHLFCGLALCSVFDLDDDYFSQHGLEADKMQIRDDIMESLSVQSYELQQVKKELKALDGVYITHIGNTFQFSHSLFRNIVTLVYNDSSFVCKYASWDYIKSRVRIHETTEIDDKYMAVYDSVIDIQRLANRFIRELKRESGATNDIVFHPSIYDDMLISCLKRQVLDNENVGQSMLDSLISECVRVMICNSSENYKRDLTTWRDYKLLVMLLQVGADCNAKVNIHSRVYNSGYIPLIKLLLDYNLDINKLDKYKRCVLHYALKDFEMTSFLLSLPTLACINQPDSRNRTPLWYAVHDKLPDSLNDTGYCYGTIQNRQEIINLYKKKGAVMLDLESDHTSTGKIG